MPAKFSAKTCVGKRSFRRCYRSCSKSISSPIGNSSKSTKRFERPAAARTLHRALKKVGCPTAAHSGFYTSLPSNRGQRLRSRGGTSAARRRFVLAAVAVATTLGAAALSLRRSVATPACRDCDHDDLPPRRTRNYWGKPARKCDPFGAKQASRRAGRRCDESGGGAAAAPKDVTHPKTLRD